jgi:hypothetical protein
MPLNMDNTTSSWLREDCLEFYRKELLSKKSSNAAGKNNGAKQPAIRVIERLGLLRLGIGKAMAVKQRFPNAQFLEFGVHEGKDLVRMATFLRSVEDQKRSQPTKNKNNSNNNNNNNNNDNSNSNSNKNNNNNNEPSAYTTFHGFDSFVGLPEDWINGQIGEDDKPFHKKGAFDTGGESPNVENLSNHMTIRDYRKKNKAADTTDIDTDTDTTTKQQQPQPFHVQFHKGWFHESLPQFLDDTDHGDEPAAFVHADADLYTSTITVLDILCSRALLRKGSILIFDEFWNYPNWEEGEYKAWLEIVDKFDLQYEYFGYHAPHPRKKHKAYGYQSVGVVITSDMRR